MIAYQLLRPLSYLSINHKKKFIFDWVAPGIISIPFIMLYLFHGAKIDFFSSDGLIKSIVSFIYILPGFYIAALSAVATFESKTLDEYLAPPTPTLKILISGESNTIKLTRRRFLSLLLSYLCFMSFILSLAGLFSTPFAETIKEILPKSLHETSAIIFSSLFTFFLWQIATTTSLCLYYLGDKLHQPEP